MTDQELFDYTQERGKALNEATRANKYKMSEAEEPADLFLRDAIQHFAKDVYNKALLARDKYGFHPMGWAYPDWKEDLQRQMAEHVLKGDPRDTGWISNMAWFHGWSTALPTPELSDEVERILDALPTELHGDGQPESRYTYEGVAEAVRKLVQKNIELIGETHRWSAAVKKLETERAAANGWIKLEPGQRYNLPLQNVEVEIIGTHRRVVCLERDADPVDGGLSWIDSEGNAYELDTATHWRYATIAPTA